MNERYQIDSKRFPLMSGKLNKTLVYLGKLVYCTHQRGVTNIILTAKLVCHFNFNAVMQATGDFKNYWRSQL
jgi:hypothetical protein